MNDRVSDSATACITINCVDRDRSADFYANVLGGTLDPDQDMNLGGFVYRIGDLKIVLLHNAETVATDQFPQNAMILLTIEVADIHEIHRRAIASQGAVIRPPDDDFSMLLNDPDGITIEVFQA